MQKVPKVAKRHRMDDTKKILRYFIETPGSCLRACLCCLFSLGMDELAAIISAEANLWGKKACSNGYVPACAKGCRKAQAKSE